MKLHSTRPTSSSGLIVILLLASLVSLQCFKQPLAPVAPNWDVQLSIPIVDTEYFLKDALRDNLDIRTSGIFYEYRPAPYDFDPIPVGDTTKLKLDPPTRDTTISQRLGIITVSPTTAINQIIPVSQVVPPITISRPPPLGDTTIFISDTSVTVIDSICIPRPLFPDTCVLTQLPGTQKDTTIAFPANPDFDYIRVQTGGLRFRIENRLPIPTVFATLKVINADNDTISALPSLSIPGRTLKDTTVNFTPGVKLTSALRVFVSVSSPVAPLPVTFLPGDGLIFRVDVTQITSDEAKIRIPATPLADIQETRLIVDDSTYIRRVAFRRGTIGLDINSSIGAAVRVRFKFKELLSIAAADTFVIDTLIAPRGNYLRNIDLTGWALQTADSNNIHFELQIRTIESTGTDTIFSTSGVTTRVQFLNTPFQIRTITGRARPFTLDVNDTINLPEIRLGSSFTADSIKLGKDTLRIYVQTAAGHPADLSLVVRGLRQDNSVAATIRIPPQGSPDPNMRRFVPAVRNEVILTGGFLDDFLRNFPNGQPARLAVIGSGIMNPYDVYNNPSAPGHIGRIDDTTKLYVGASFLVPLQVAIYNGVFKDTVRIGDTTTTGTQVDPNLLTSILEGNFFFRIQNSIPVNLKLKTDFLNQAGVSIVADSVSIFDTTGVQTPMIRLTKDRALKFNESKRAVIKLFLGTGNQAAAFDTTQSIRVRMFANLKFNVNPTK